MTEWLLIERDGVYVLIGKVWSDKRFEDGTVVATSPIKSIINQEGTAIAETKNSLYTLTDRLTDLGKAEAIKSTFWRFAGNDWIITMEEV